MEELNKTFDHGHILESAEMNQIVGKVNEVIREVNEQIPEAPEDGKTYGRNNGQWEDLSTAFATKEELGDIGSVLDTINGEVI